MRSICCGLVATGLCLWAFHTTNAAEARAAGLMAFLWALAMLDCSETKR